MDSSSNSLTGLPGFRAFSCFSASSMDFCAFPIVTVISVSTFLRDSKLVAAILMDEGASVFVSVVCVCK